MASPLPSSPRARHAIAALVAAGALLLSTASSSPAAASTAAPTRAAGPACAVASTPNQRYVAFLFDEILHRCPDVRAAAYWTARLDGGASRWSVAEAIDTSTENLGRNNVDGLYQGLLGRAPTATERDAWIRYLRSAHENAVPTAMLLSSAEGYARHTTATTAAERDVEWLTAAYNRILDRAPDPKGLAYYQRKLGPGASTQATRYAVAMSLEHSAPNANSWVRAAMTEALGRTPDPSGIRSWTAWLTGPGRWQTFRLWTHLLSSDEAYRRAIA